LIQTLLKPTPTPTAKKVYFDPKRDSIDLDQTSLYKSTDCLIDQINYYYYVFYLLASTIFIVFLSSLIPIMHKATVTEYSILCIYRHLERHGLTPSGPVDKLAKVPKPFLDIVYYLSKLAFKGLQENKLVFTFDEIKQHVHILIRQ